MEEKNIQPTLQAIRGYEGRYSITPDGRVWSHPRIIVKKDRWGNLKKFYWKGGWIKSHSTKEGNWYYSIRFGRSRKGFKIHRLVAEAYIPNPQNLPEVNHKNGNKGDNRVENLEWCDRKQNLAHGYILRPNETRNFRRGSLNKWAKLTEEKVLAIRSKYAAGGISQRELARQNNVTPGRIRDVVMRISWRHV